MLPFSHNHVQRFRALLGLFSASKGSVRLVVALGLVASLFEGVSLYLFLPILQQLPGSAVSEEQISRIWTLVHAWLPEELAFWGLLGFAFLGILLKNVVSYVNEAVFASINCRAGHTLRRNLYRQILSASSSHINKTSSGEISNAMLSESWRSVDALGELYRILVAICAVTVLLGVLLLISWTATLLVCGLGILLTVVTSKLTAATQEASAQAVVANKQFISIFWETMEGLSTIRQFAQAKQQAERFDARSHAVEKIYLRLQLIHNRVGPSTEVLMAFFVTMLLGVMFSLGVSGAGIAVFLVVAFRAARAFRNVLSGANRLAQLSQAVEEVESVGHACESSALETGTLDAWPPQHAIRLRNCCYNYPGRSAASLSNIDIDIPVGKTIAFIGHSGAGKTSLMQLLYREFDPDRGCVEIDGTDLRDMDIESWRRQLAIVPQVTHLFDTTIAGNIAFGRPDATLDQIKKAAQEAHAHDFIEALPQGYQTEIGNKGIRLSGGQRQRISFARALVTNPSVLILDEATNELDSETERLIMENVTGAGNRRTTIIITHRTSALANCDLVVTLSQGTVSQGPVSQGTVSQGTVLEGASQG